MNRQGAYVRFGSVGGDPYELCLFRTLKEIFRQKRATTKIVALIVLFTFDYLNKFLNQSAILAKNFTIFCQNVSF